MTYSLFEFAKDNAEDLMPDGLFNSFTIQVSTLVDDCLLPVEYLSVKR